MLGTALKQRMVAAIVAGLWTIGRQLGYNVVQKRSRMSVQHSGVYVKNTELFARVLLVVSESIRPLSGHLRSSIDGNEF